MMDKHRKCDGNKQRLCKYDCQWCFSRSFASTDFTHFWSKENGESPRDVFSRGDKVYWFQCIKEECNHLFQTQIKNISRGSGCPFCSKPIKKLCKDGNCQWCFEKSFAFNSKSKFWSSENDFNPREVFLYSHTKYKFKCDKCNHIFEATPHKISAKKNPTWCPYCCNSSKKRCDDKECKLCFENSFANHPKSKFWSYEDNETKPWEIMLGTEANFWFLCDKKECGHKFKISINKITGSNRWCPYHCIPSKKLCPDENCESCFKRSFASHPKSKFWSKKNDKMPRDVFLWNHDKFLFFCDSCKKDFSTAPESIASGRWCPTCKHKTEKKLYSEFLSKYNTICQPKYDWCRNPETNKHLPFDFVIEDQKVIIELDGVQHFRQVANWQSPEETQERDRYKEERAIENGYSLIRLYQEDVFYDKTDWKDLLEKAINNIEPLQIILIYEEETRIKLVETETCIFRYESVKIYI
jgi:hypothetical protein